MDATLNTEQLPTWVPQDERTVARREIGLPIMISGQRMSPASVLMTDVSSLGCRITSVVHVHVGTFLQIEIPGFTKFEGWVAWQRKTEIGIDFAHAVPEAVVEHLLSLTR